MGFLDAFKAMLWSRLRQDVAMTVSPARGETARSSTARNGETVEKV
jgi:hypothetical protein